MPSEFLLSHYTGLLHQRRPCTCLVQLVLLGQGNCLAPPQSLLVNEGADAAELHQLMLLKLCCQAELIEVVIRGDAIPQSLYAYVSVPISSKSTAQCCVTALVECTLHNGQSVHLRSLNTLSSMCLCDTKLTAWIHKMI